MKGLAAFVMSGRGQAVLVIVAFSLLSVVIPPASYLAGGAVGLVTLRQGWLEGLFVTAGATLVAGTLGLVALGSPLPVLALLALLWLPVWALAQVLRSAAAQGPTLTVAALAAVGAVLLVYVVVGSPAEWWRAVLEESLVPMFREQGVTLDPAVLDRIAEVMTGVVAAATVLGASLSLFVARWWQALLYNPGGFGEEFRALRLDWRVAAATAVLVLALLIAPTGLRRLAAELLLVALVVLTLQGLAVAHALLGPRPGARAWLGGLYVALVVLWPYPMLALAATGWADAWLDFRRRLVGSRPPT